MAGIRHAAIVLLTCAAMVLSAATATAKPPLTNWELFVVSVGDRPVSHYTITNRAVVHRGAGPAVSGVGLAGPSGPGNVFIQTTGSPNVELFVRAGSAQLRQSLVRSAPSTWQGAVGVDATASLPARSRQYVLIFWTNSTASFGKLTSRSRPGAVSVTRLTGSGAAAVFADSTTPSGPALVSPGASAGLLQAAINAPTGIVGTLGNRTSTWTSPDGRTGQDSFSGPAGDWRFSWTGPAIGAGPPVIAAWAPVGQYWSVFRQA